MARSAGQTAGPRGTRAKRPAGSRRRAGSKGGDAGARLRGAMLHLMATEGWCDLSLARIAAEAGLDMADAHATYPTRAAILAAIARETDADLLASLRDDPLEGGARDRLFDLLMRRFDRLQRHRDAYLTLLRELPHTPLEAACLGRQLRRSLGLLLEVAGFSSAGLRGALRLQGLIAVYLAGLRVWRQDDSADLARTMAEIDRRLGQAARLAEMCATTQRAAA